VKPGVEAGDLWHIVDSIFKCRDQRDLAGQVVRVEGAYSPELIEHLRRYERRLDESIPPVDDPVPYGRDRGEPQGSLNSLDYQASGNGLVGSLDRALFQMTVAGNANDQPGFSAPDPFDATGEDSFDRIAHPEDRELQAG
jgi:hypothetical protein